MVFPDADLAVPWLSTEQMDVLRDFDRCSELEWLETTGLGGWASSTVAGAHSRRYHGLLVAALKPPVHRVVLVSKLDEVLHIDGTNHPLASNRFPGAVHPDGHTRLSAFRRDLFPVFEWQVAGVELRKTVAGIDGDPPHTPRGAAAQAWSVAELLRAVIEKLDPQSNKVSEVCLEPHP